MDTPREVRIQPWLASVVGAAVGGGAIFGVLSKPGDQPAARRILRATFFAAAFGFLTISILDFWEHWRLERETAGKYWAAKAVPIGETINHVITMSTVLVALLAARPLQKKLEARDWIAIGALPVYFAFGWRDELVYHRRRAKHREDMMHTMAHLAAAAMLGAHYGSRFPRWTESQ